MWQGGMIKNRGAASLKELERVYFFYIFYTLEREREFQFHQRISRGEVQFTGEKVLLLAAKGGLLLSAGAASIWVESFVSSLKGRA